MTTKPLKDRVKETLDHRKMSFLDLEKSTNIPANRMYKWYQQNTNPKARDAETLEKWLNSVENIQNPVSLAEEPEVAYASVRNLTESNRILAEANRTLAETLAEAQHLISKNHDELIQLTNMIVTNSPASTKNLQEAGGPEHNNLKPGHAPAKPLGSEGKSVKPKGKH